MRGTFSHALALALTFASAAAFGGVPQYSLSPASQTIDVGAQATLTLSMNLTSNTDTVVALDTSDNSVLMVPANATIPAGQMMTTFQVRGLLPGTADVIADPNAQAVTASVTVQLPGDGGAGDAGTDGAPAADSGA